MAHTPFYDRACYSNIICMGHGTQSICSVKTPFASMFRQTRFPSLVEGQQARYTGAVWGGVQRESDARYPAMWCPYFGSL